MNSKLNNVNLPLASGETYTGGWEDITLYEVVNISIISDQNSNVTVYFSSDRTNEDFAIVNEYTNTTNGVNYEIVKKARYVRIDVENVAGTDQTYLRCNTEYKNVVAYERVKQFGNYGNILNNETINSNGETSAFSCEEYVSSQILIADGDTLNTDIYSIELSTDGSNYFVYPEYVSLNYNPSLSITKRIGKLDIDLTSVKEIRLRNESSSNISNCYISLVGKSI